MYSHRRTKRRRSTLEGGTQMPWWQRPPLALIHTPGKSWCTRRNSSWQNLVNLRAVAAEGGKQQPVPAAEPNKRPGDCREKSYLSKRGFHPDKCLAIQHGRCSHTICRYTHLRFYGGRLKPIKHSSLFTQTHRRTHTRARALVDFSARTVKWLLTQIFSEAISIFRS